MEDASLGRHPPFGEHVEVTAFAHRRPASQAKSAKQLRTYLTSLGFFDEESASSMKAALQAWGTTTNLFQRVSPAKWTTPTVIAAIMRKPRGFWGSLSDQTRHSKSIPTCPTGCPAHRSRADQQKSLVKLTGGAQIPQFRVFDG